MSKKTLVPIRRNAREPAERAIKALRELNAADPYVFAALLELQWGHDRLPRSTRAQMRLVRERAHDMKERAIRRALETERERELARTEVH